MTKGEEKRREKARALRYRKPAVKDLNIAEILEQLMEIEEECAEVHWYCDSEDGWDTLLNALDNDDDDAWEFRTAFAELEGQCERMRDDLTERFHLAMGVTEGFDIFFAGIGAGATFGGMMGYDEYEQDYFGLEPGWESEQAEKTATEKLKRLTKDELLDTAGRCFRIAVNFLSLRHRYDNLKAAMDILREQNTALLQQVKAIEEAYEAATRSEYEWENDTGRFDALLRALPDRAWIE